jgi:hypothetical protein
MVYVVQDHRSRAQTAGDPSQTQRCGWRTYTVLGPSSICIGQWHTALRPDQVW